MPQGQAYVIAVSPIRLPGVQRDVMDDVIQEIDIRTGLVLFEWHAIDHIGLDESYEYGPQVPGHILDPFHLNSVSLDRDGNLIVSGRNTSAIYKIDHSTGQILWRYGGADSSFALGPGAAPAFQHDARIQPDGTLTMFDNGAGPPTVHPFSRGLKVSLDVSRATASLDGMYAHAPQISSNFEGSMQALPGRDMFLGWGQQPYFSEVASDGEQDLDGRFIARTSSYRAYRFPWDGSPMDAPSVAATPGPEGTTELSVSWNGATSVTRWRVLAGVTSATMAPLKDVAKTGFETPINIPAGYGYVEVQALASSGRVLSTSAVQSSSASAGGGGGVAFGSKALVSLQLAAPRIPATGPLKIRVGNGEPFEVTGMLWALTSSKVTGSRTRLIKLQPKAFSVDAHTSKTVVLKLPRVLQREFARRHRLQLRLAAKVKDPAGDTRSIGKRVTVRLKKSHRP